MNVTATLAQWLTQQRWENIPDPARRKAVDVVIDSIGAMIACSRLPEVEAIVKLL